MRFAITIALERRTAAAAIIASRMGTLAARSAVAFARSIVAPARSNVAPARSAVRRLAIVLAVVRLRARAAGSNTEVIELLGRVAGHRIVRVGDRRCWRLASGKRCCLRLGTTIGTAVAVAAAAMCAAFKALGTARLMRTAIAAIPAALAAVV